jgi:NitT/TauT family transport system permease protein
VRAEQQRTKWRSRALALVGIGVVWEVFGYLLEIRTQIWPTPSRVLLEAFREGPLLVRHGLFTIYEILAGFLLGASVTFPASVIAAACPDFSRRALPFFRFSRSLPILVVAPLFVVWFGYGMLPKILLASLLGAFSVALATLEGMVSLRPEMLELARATGAGRIQTFLKIQVPASLPHIFRGLKLAAPLSVVGVTVGEFLGAELGLGHLLLAANSSLNTPLLVAAMSILILIGIALYHGVQGLEHALVPGSAARASREFLSP